MSVSVGGHSPPKRGSAGAGGPLMLAGRPAAVLRWSRGQSAIGWLAVVVALSVGALVFSRVPRGGASVWFEVSLSVLSTLPLLWVRHRPAAGVLVPLAAGAAFAAVAPAAWPAAAFAAWLLAWFVCPVVLPRAWSIGTLVIGVSIPWLGLQLPGTEYRAAWQSAAISVLAAVLCWGVGESVRAGRAGAARRAVTEAELTRLRDSESAARVRAEVARELHDVVAHRVSLVAVHAATAAYRMPELELEAAMVLEDIASQAREALTELRGVLGVLRGPDGAASVVPQPGIGDLPALLDRLRQGGVDAQLRVTGAARELPQGVQVCCYRVIQEALTNAARHAAGNPVGVEVTYGDKALMIRVHNQVDTAPGPITPGFGLKGMQERITAAGGVLQIGSTGREFIVAARIPLPPVSGAGA